MCISRRYEGFSMFKLKKFLFTLAISVVSLTSISMEKTPTFQVSAATTHAIFSHKENIFKSLENDIKQANFVSFDTLVFTNQTLINALEVAHDNDAHVEGTCGTHWCNRKILSSFDKKDIDVSRKSQNHLKRFLCSEKDPRLGSPGKCVIYEGSANPTNYAYHNDELLVRTENDKLFFMDHYNNHSDVMDDVAALTLSEKKVLELTPQKQNQAFGSHENLLSASKKLRVQNLITSTNEQRMLYISSMSWNSTDMTQALIDAHKSGVSVKVILDRSALTGNGKDQLAQMHTAGVPIYVYYPGKNSRNIQHMKVMLRIDGSEYLVVNSTANMTPEGDKESNIDSYYPQSEQMGKKIKNELDVSITSDTYKPYTQEIADLAKNKKTEKSQAAKKRILLDKTNIDNHTLSEIDNATHGNNKKMKTKK